MSGSLAVLAAATAAVVIAALAAAVLVRTQRRARRQIGDLLARLERLEQRHGAPAAADGEHGAPQAQNAVVPAVADTVGQETPPSGDVLAGLTSHVRRLVHAPGQVVSLADQAIVCIHRRLEENVQPAQIAEELLVSLRTLERGLAMALDCTPRQLIVAMKMREARRLLLDGTHRVADVAERLGFADPFHFSRRFKSFYGVSPSEVRPEVGSRRDAAGGSQA
jgi:AraC-like DNA-binding protein